jgi:hypothetical protein
VNREDIIRMAREAGLVTWFPNSTYTDGCWWIEAHEPDESLEQFAALVAAAEREAIADEFWMSLQSDLEHGVKSLNEKAAADYQKNYPGLRAFTVWLNKRGAA